MAKIGELGNSGLGQIPKNWKDNASRGTFLQPWPTFKGKGEIGPLEPYGNPAYEGYGYPAAGYGITRRKVVKLALPKVPAGQLTAGGWEGKVPQGTRITSMGTLNPKSDYYSTAQVAVLQGLNGLGQAKAPAAVVADPNIPPEVVNQRTTFAWNIIKQMDELAVQAKAEKPWKITQSVRETTGFDAPGKALINLADNYFPTLRPRLIGEEGKFEKLYAAVRAPERNWKAWVDSAKNLASEFRTAMGDNRTYTLMGAVVYTTVETAKKVVEGVQEAGNRTLSVLDFLTQPWVMGTLLVGAGAIYLFAKGGGSFVSVNRSPQQPQFPPMP
jgi:hypothetical protein